MNPSTHILVCLLSLIVLSGCEFRATGTAERDFLSDSAAKSGAPTFRIPSHCTIRVSESGHDWPQWRGPLGTGVSLEANWSRHVHDRQGVVAWNASVGTGYSAVSIHQGRLYTMGYSDGREIIHCLDASTGAELWNRGYASPKLDHLNAGGPGSTPTVDGPFVYVVGRDGQLSCLLADSGDVHWATSLKESLRVKTPEWGFTSSPLIVGDLVIVEAGRLAAFDKTSGSPIWRTDMYRPGYGSPVCFESAGQPIVATLNNDGLLLARIDDGEEFAFHPWETQYATNATTPIVRDNSIFLSTGYNRGCTLLAWSPKQQTLQPVYENRKMRNQMNNCVLWDGHLYGFDGNSNRRRHVDLVCMEYATGRVKWKQRGLGCGSLMVADGTLIILSDDGQLVTARASARSFHEIARVKVLNGICWTVPVLAQGRIYCRSDAGELVCLDVRPESYNTNSVVTAGETKSSPLGKLSKNRNTPHE